MVISYHGGECFKISFGDTTIALNPISKNSKLKPARFGSDIALVSLNHPDTNGVEQVAHGERQPFVISGPGEYEIKGIAIKGFPSTSSYGEKGSINTIYTIRLEGMNLCFLGALNDRKLEGSVVEALGTIDVLFVPIGGEGVLPPAEAHTLAVELGASIEIPMHYEGMGEKDALKKFLKEEGAEGVKAVDKLTIKKKDLEGKESEVVVLQA